MKLKRLDIHGFKSFYHRTTLAFDDGITAIVGPNGCGKSNIVDAIKWVMGEQGARALRGSTMEDVIFGGSGKRGPMGMCEVGLVFENLEPVKITGELVNPSEIGIERRLERGRGSDYMVNRRRCRLVDVQELVAGTGVGAGPGGRRAYAIIEQGQISRVVSAKADERRALIEEAAGITVYRQRRRLAERKFQETEQNLERVLDIIGEVETQLRSLRRQSKKALRFKAYHDESQAIGLRVAAFEYFDFEVALLDSQTLAGDTRQAVEDLRIVLETAEVETEALRLAHKQAETELRQSSGALRQAEERGRLAAERMAGLTREREVLVEQLGRAQQDASDGEARRHELEAEHVVAIAALRSLEDDAELDSERLETARSMEKAAARALLEGRALLERLTRRESEELERMARAVAQRDVARSRIEGLRAELGNLGDEERGLERRDEELRDGQGIAQGLVESALEAKSEGEAAHAGLQRELDAVYLKRDDARKVQQGCLERSVAQKARIESLRELIARSSELSDGNRALLQSGAAVVKGPISELFSVPEELEPAVLAALGHRLDGVVVENLDDAMSLVSVLQESGGGRGLCFAIDGQPQAPSKLPKKAGVVGWLSDVLPKQVSPAAYILLQGWLMVDDATSALALVKDGWTGNMVTRHGERFEGGGIIEGGTFKEGGPLSHRRALDQLEAHLVELEGEHERATQLMNRLTEEVTSYRSRLEVQNKENQSAKDHVSALKLDVERLERDQARLTEDRARLLKRTSLLAEQVTREKTGAEQAEKLCAEVQEAKTSRAAEISLAEEQVIRAQSERDNAVAEVHEARARVTARTERLTSARMVESRLRRQLEEIGRRQVRSEELGKVTSTRLEQIAAHLAEDEAARLKAESDALALSAEVQKARVLLQEHESVLGQTQRDLKSKRAELEKKKTDLADAKLEEEKASLRLTASWERLRERFQVTHVEMLDQYKQGDPPDASERDRLATLDELMQKMGDVNLASIEECEVVQDRHDFLIMQSQDLTDGLGNLQKAIKEIDETSKRLFGDAFDAINTHFKLLFPRLFCGGAAELELTNPADLLNTGVHMKARPPGKKIQSVELMSGGEKAMCALALIFAVFRFSPSPFCLLDEVDAPLDDANIGRFNEVVRELAEQSQVVLVTHNKRTMEIADALYGVTMEEAGVSKLVSVRMS